MTLRLQASFALSPEPRSAEPPRKPSVVSVPTDDLAQGAVGCYGQTVIKTPNRDRMAAQGTKTRPPPWPTYRPNPRSSAGGTGSRSRSSCVRPDDSPVLHFNRWEGRLRQSHESFFGFLEATLAVGEFWTVNDGRAR